MEENKLAIGKKKKPLRKFKEFIESLWRTKKNLVIVFICLVVVAFFVYACIFYSNSGIRGNAVGTAAGTIAGKAAGSWNGVTEGIKEGKKKGEKAGLSADDTKVDFTGRLQAEGKLEVLEYTGTINNFFSIGEEQNYAVLYEMDYQAIYTVDLSDPDNDIYEDENGLHLTLKKPGVKIITGEPQMIREHQGKAIDWTLTGTISAVTGMPIIIQLNAGTAKKGTEAYQNEKEALIAKAEKRFTEERFRQEADKAAEKAINGLVGSMSLSSPKVFINWK